MCEVTGNVGAAHRLSIWNGFDLTTNDGLKGILQSIDRLKPERVWLSPECGPYSVMQNINQWSPEQKEKLAEKRRVALKQYTACAIIFHYCLQKGIHATWELSQSCQAWRLPLFQEIQRRHVVHFSNIRGCQVNLRDKMGNLISKGW